MKYTHPNHPHVYYVSSGMYGYQVKQYNKEEGIPGSTLNLSDQEYVNFKAMLKNGGWNEQSTSR